MAEVDKAAVRDDYRRGFSVRQLEAKYNVPKSTIGRWVKKFGWQQEAKRAPADLGTPQNENVGQRGTVGQPEQWDGSEDYAALRETALLAKQRIDTALALADDLSARDLRALCAALLDVRTLLGVQTPREAAESELRILALRRETEGGGSSEVTVRFVETEGAEA